MYSDNSAAVCIRIFSAEGRGYMTEDGIKKMAYSLGADVCGIAAADRFTGAPEGFRPNDILPGAKSVVVYGRHFSESLFAASTNVPYTLVRNKMLDMMDELSVDLCTEMEKEGLLSVPVPAAEPYDFWNPEPQHGRGILSLKHAARLAGLGFIGKNTLLINRKYGNRLWLGAIITDMPLESDALDTGSCFEGCRLCIDSCPQSALNGTTIEQIKCREISGTYTEGGGFVLSCNLCRKVCPFSKV